LDPPTFSQSRLGGVFRAEKDFARLVRSAVQLLAPDGVLLASTNAAQWPPPAFLECLRTAIRSEGRRVCQEHYAPQPPDFPICRAQPGYLKTVWLRVG
jgi:23S rRNA (cytosine1962-C5)-methyltransferase